MSIPRSGGDGVGGADLEGAVDVQIIDFGRYPRLGGGDNEDSVNTEVTVDRGAEADYGARG